VWAGSRMGPPLSLSPLSISLPLSFSLCIFLSLSRAHTHTHTHAFFVLGPFSLCHSHSRRSHTLAHPPVVRTRPGRGQAAAYARAMAHGTLALRCWCWLWLWALSVPSSLPPTETTVYVPLSLSRSLRPLIVYCSYDHLRLPSLLQTENRICLWTSLSDPIRLRLNVLLLSVLLILYKRNRESGRRRGRKRGPGAWEDKGFCVLAG
jgi:hypothetical protein